MQRGHFTRPVFTTKKITPEQRERHKNSVYYKQILASEARFKYSKWNVLWAAIALGTFFSLIKERRQMERYRTDHSKMKTRITDEIDALRAWRATQQEEATAPTQTKPVQ
eukprot:TRINITY_DN2427_c0_g1_i1.p1 TRINITY_DN2427_c0_g1~~TRINITY_DN2427_c0_g1_i1.p1  ORF type:complete len:110 (-),score=19.73 TRINITY_DN2427_c0_g1_i1:127-456(-)